MSHRYLLINAYSKNNRGDAGIVVAMISLLRNYDPESEIFVMSSYWKENKDFYLKYNVESVPAVWDLSKDNSSIKRYIRGTKSFFTSFLSNKNNNQLSYYNMADTVISVGGGYLYSSRRGPLGIGLLNSLFHIYLAKKMKKTVICFPQSVGPLNYIIDKWIVKKVLKKVDLFMSREAITTKLLKSFGLKKVIEIPDIGFTLSPADIGKIHDISNDNLNIGITLLDWRFARKDSTWEDIEEYVKKIGNVCLEIIKLNNKTRFYIFPQVTVGTGDTDKLVSEIFIDYVGKDKAFLMDLDKSITTPEQLVTLYGKMNLFIGSRMHSTIFALAANTPTIALAYQYKTIGTFNLLGLGKYVLDTKNFKEEELKDLAISSIKSKDYPLKIVNEKIKEIYSEITNSLDKIMSKASNE